MKNKNELFIVESENGEWLDNTGDGGWSCWTTQAEAQDALDSEADNGEDQRTAYKIVRFVREITEVGNANGQSAKNEYFASGYTRKDLKAMHPNVELEPEWVMCPQCSRENSRDTWDKFGGKCPNCRDLYGKD